MATQFLSLTNLGHGAATEQFDEQLRQALENIADANTDPKAPRAITLHVVLKPREDRKAAAAVFWVTSKLAPWRKFEAALAIGNTADGMAAREIGVTGDLFDEGGGPAPAVTGEKHEPTNPPAIQLVGNGEKGGS